MTAVLALGYHGVPRSKLQGIPTKTNKIFDLRVHATRMTYFTNLT